MRGQLKFDDPKALEKKVEEYFIVMDKTGRPYTISGLSFYLGTNRMTLLNSRNRNPEIDEIISRAKDRIESYVEEQLFLNPRTTGCIFNLKNNFGWKDQQEVNFNANQNQNLLSEMSTEEIKKILQEPTDYEIIENAENIISEN